MTTILIMLLILTLLFAIRIEINIDGTIWKEKDTDRPIIIISYNENGITYRYSEEPFDRMMSLWDLLTKYKYIGDA